MPSVLATQINIKNKSTQFCRDLITKSRFQMIRFEKYKYLLTNIKNRTKTHENISDNKKGSQFIEPAAF